MTCCCPVIRSFIICSSLAAHPTHINHTPRPKGSSGAPRSEGVWHDKAVCRVYGRGWVLGAFREFTARKRVVHPQTVASCTCLRPQGRLNVACERGRNSRLLPREAPVRGSVVCGVWTRVWFAWLPRPQRPTWCVALSSESRKRASRPTNTHKYTFMRCRSTQQLREAAVLC